MTKNQGRVLVLVTVLIYGLIFWLAMSPAKEEKKDYTTTYLQNLVYTKDRIPLGATNFKDAGNGWISFDWGPANFLTRNGREVAFSGPSEWFREFHEFEDELKRLRETPAPKPTDNPDRRTADATSGT